MEDRLNQFEKRLTDLENKFNEVDKNSAILNIKLDTIIQSIDNLTTALEKNNIAQKQELEKLKSRQDELEKKIEEKTTGKQAENWNKFTWLIISNIAVLILGFVFTFLKLK